MRFFKTASFGLYVLLTLSSLATNARECSSFLSRTYISSQNHKFLIQNSLIQPESWASDLALLATQGHLISQSDPSLSARGLLVESGGLCGPTCVAFIVASKDFYQSKRRSFYWVENIDSIVLRLINNYQTVALGLNDPTGHDPRLGTVLELYTSRFNQQNLEWGLYSRQIDEESISHMNYYLNIKNGIVIATASFLGSSSSPSTAKHALILLGVHTEHQLLTLIDPNQPWDVLVTKYEIKNNKIHFRLNDSLYGGQGQSDVYISAATSFTIN
jgi:hypothetical protein